MKFFFIKADDYQIGQAVEVRGEPMTVHSYVPHPYARTLSRGKELDCRNFYALNPKNGNLTLCVCTDSTHLIEEVTA